MLQEMDAENLEIGSKAAIAGGYCNHQYLNRRCQINNKSSNMGSTFKEFKNKLKIFTQRKIECFVIMHFILVQHQTIFFKMKELACSKKRWNIFG